MNETAKKRVEEARAEVVAKVVEMMQQEGLNWVDALAGGSVPHNYVSGKPYRGRNRLHLAAACCVNGWSDPRFLTYNQARKCGLHVKKGEHGTVIEKWKTYVWAPSDTEDGEETGAGRAVSHVALVGWWTVFNVEQCEGDVKPLCEHRIYDEEQLAEAAETAFGASPCEVEESDATSVAYYSPAADRIGIYKRTDATSLNGWIRTLLHEEAHATGHESRLARKNLNRFGTPDYAREELVAELSAAFLAAEMGLPERSATDAGEIEHMEQHAAYLQNWISVLKDDPDELFKAASAAERAADMIAASWRPEESEEAPAADDLAA